MHLVVRYLPQVGAPLEVSLTLEQWLLLCAMNQAARQDSLIPSELPPTTTMPAAPSEEPHRTSPGSMVFLRPSDDDAMLDVRTELDDYAAARLAVGVIAEVGQ